MTEISIINPDPVIVIVNPPETSVAVVNLPDVVDVVVEDSVIQVEITPGGMPPPGSDGSPRSVSPILTTPNLPDGDSYISTIDLAKSYRVIVMTVSEACRVRLYATTIGAETDISRPVLVDPPDGLGVMFDYAAPYAGTFMLSPTVDGSCMNDPLNNEIPISVVNLSGETTSIDVSFVYQTTER